MLDFFGFSLPILYVHLGTLVCLVPLVLYADHQAFQWIMGHKETLNKNTLQTVHYLTLFGLILMILSGSMMALPVLQALFTVPAFLLKMAFVTVLVINSFFIGRLMHTAIERPFSSLSFKEKVPLFVSGGVSTLGWVGAFLSAIFMGFGTVLGILNSLF